MFYTESITIPAKKISLFSRIYRAFEIAGMARAARELQRLGYNKEYKRALEQLRKLRDEE